MQLFPRSDREMTLESLFSNALSLHELNQFRDIEWTKPKPTPLFELNSFKKVFMLTGIKENLETYCYIPKRNLLVLLLKDRQTARIISTYNFKTVLIKTFKIPIHAVVYIKELDEIFFGGENFFWEVYSLKTLKGAIRMIEEIDLTITGCIYLPEHNRYAFALEHYGIIFFSQEFKVRGKLPIGKVEKLGKEMFNIDSTTLCLTGEETYRKKIFSSIWRHKS